MERTISPSTYYEIKPVRSPKYDHLREAIDRDYTSLADDKEEEEE